jgi:O-antigen/teichoic acid export membrane protein
MTHRVGNSHRVAGSGVAFHNLLRHSSIYGLGQILSRLASFLLLPVYTAYLRPADYGLLAILDLAAGILSLLLGRGIVTAVNRYHFEDRDEARRDQLWWTGLTFLAIMATAAVVPAWLLRDTLARLTLGPVQDYGGYYYTLTLGRIWFGIVGELPNSYLRVRKWSGVYIGSAFARLLLNIGLNIYFLIVLDLGVAGILLGNLIATGVKTTALTAIFLRLRGPYVLHWPLMRKLWQFGGPIIITALLSLIMHRADHYMLRLFLGLEQVGIYSLAYTVGQTINTLCLLPFAAIWEVEMYEIAEQPDAKHVYAKVFQYFAYGLMLVMLGVSLFARPILGFIAAPAYAEAIQLIPIVCLAYIFFSLHEHFRVPALLAKRTLSLLPAYIVAAVTNIGMNLIMIPLLGAAGAAWTSVLTFFMFSFIGLWRYRTIDRYDYPLLKCGAVLLGMAVSYLVYRSLDYLSLHYMWSLGMAAIIWLVWAVVLLGPLAWRLLVHRKENTVWGNLSLGDSR